MRIAIVNDTLIAVEAMRRVLLQAKGHELAWVARDGAEAVKCCAEDTPDLVLMDLVMPEMDGVEAIRRIMAGSPCAIVVVTASVNRHCSKVFEALGAGALDAVNTPTLEHAGANIGTHSLLGKIQTINRLIGNKQDKADDSSTPQPQPNFVPRKRLQLVVIGASAGGPAAVAKVLSKFPPDFPAAIIVIQHVDSQFVDGLANWLAYQTPLPVRLAKEGDHPQPGMVLLAGTRNHLVFSGPGTLGYTPYPLDFPYRPSIDVFFESLGDFWRGDVVGVLLTGMGRDGANGLKTIHDAGHQTIVQDKATSAVFGMPKAAVELKAASEVLPIDKIGPRVVTILQQLSKHNART
jgi:two-component system response regulator WspF